MLALVATDIAAEGGGHKFAAWQFGLFAAIVLVAALVIVLVVLGGGRPHS